jgi:hypothetical protein
MRYLRHACAPSAAQVAHDALRGMLVPLERLKSKGPAACVTAYNLQRLVLVAVILANKYLDRTQRTAGCFAGGALALPRVWLHTHALQDDRLKHRCFCCCCKDERLLGFVCRLCLVCSHERRRWIL